MAPGFVDVHGDAFERQVSPRPGRIVDAELAVLDTDRQLAAAGITTAYHALTLSWEPGLRSVEQGERFLSALDGVSDRVGVDHRVQLRWETFAFEAIPLIETHLGHARRPTLALNDHLSMNLRPPGCSLLERPTDVADADAFIDPTHPVARERFAKMATRSGIGQDGFDKVLRNVWARRPAVPDTVRGLTAKARAAGVTIFSHDDNTIDARRRSAEFGATVVEFPMTRAVADDAHADGVPIVLGSPNIVFGGSHTGAVNAADMIAEGLCDVLASDYHYPSMLMAAKRLTERGDPLIDTWHRLSLNAARACGLEDRGMVRPGARADLILLRWDEPVPSVVATIAAGRIVHLTEAWRLRSDAHATSARA